MSSHPKSVGRNACSLRPEKGSLSTNPSGRREGECPVSSLKMRLKLRMVENPHASEISVIVIPRPPCKKRTAASVRP